MRACEGGSDPRALADANEIVTFLWIGERGMDLGYKLHILGLDQHERAATVEVATHPNKPIHVGVILKECGSVCPSSAVTRGWGLRQLFGAQANHSESRIV